MIWTHSEVSASTDGAVSLDTLTADEGTYLHTLNLSH